MVNNIDTELFELIFEFTRSVKEKTTNLNDTGNITIQQYMALSFIEKNKILQMKEIADWFSIEMPTATSLINKLNKQALVKRTTDIKDRRVVNISLTKKGETLLGELRKKQEIRVKKMLSYLTVKQKNNMLDILKTVLQKI